MALTLQEAKVRVSNTTCDKFEDFDLISSLCGVPLMNATFCLLDPGNPLMMTIKEDPNQWYLFGILDHFPVEDNKCKLNSPTYFTKISVYQEWIEQIILKHDFFHHNNS